ncbi:glutamate receptor-like [Zootermopsis nevadensis]|nr:glutamate receptor-like [Zootermopsis nevadensis]
MLTRNEVDIATTNLIATAQRLDVVDFISPIADVRTTVHIRKPDPVSNISNLVRAFDTAFWGAVVMTIALLSTSLSLSIVWYHVSIRLEKHLCDIISESFLHISGSFLCQGSTINVRSSVIRAISVTSYLTATVVMAAYSAAFVSNLTIQSLQLPFTTYEGLLKDGRFRLLAVSGTAQLNYFDQSSNPLIEEVYETLMKPIKQSMPRSQAEGLQRLCSEDHIAFAGVETGVDSFKGQLACEIVRLPATAIPASMAMAITKGSPYKRILSHYSSELRRNGILSRISSTTIPRTLDNAGELFSEIEFKSVALLFTALAMGFVAAITILIGELISKYVLTKLEFPQICWYKK